MVKMSKTELSDYITLGRDLDELFANDSSVMIDGAVYNNPKELEDSLNRLSHGGLHCTPAKE